MLAILAEDDRDNANLVTMVLEELGYNVIWYKAVDQAIGHLADCHGKGVDLVLLDRHTLGRMDGVRALANTMAVEYPEIPALLCSHEADDHKRYLNPLGYSCTKKIGLDSEMLNAAIQEAKEGVNIRAH